MLSLSRVAQASAVALLGLGLCAPAAHGACDATVAVGESVQSAVNGAAPGEVVCLRGGIHSDPDREFRVTARGAGVAGTSDARWIVVQSFPGETATLHGRLVVTRDAALVRFTQLVLDGSGGPLMTGSPPQTYPSPTVSGQSITFERDEVTNGRTGICFNESPPQFGQASQLQVRFSRIHDCGTYPPTNHSHGIYLEVPTSSARITDNWIYDNADRCIQMYPNADNAYIVRNVLDGCGEGVLFAGSAEDGFCAASDGNLVERNVISNARVRWLAESYWGCSAVGTGNLLRRNCLWPTNPDSRYNANGGLDGGSGYRAQANRVANPLYADREAKDFRLKRTSPCVGRGPRAVPGP